jgi:hypothetical protein
MSVPPATLAPMTAPKLSAPVDELLERRRTRVLQRKHELLGTPKRKVLSDFLALGPVTIWFDPRRPGTEAPAKWRRRSHMQLKITRSDVQSIHPAHLIARATAEGQLWTIRIAWRWIYSIVADDVGGVVWRGDAPVEVQRSLRPDPDEPVRLG